MNAKLHLLLAFVACVSAQTSSFPGTPPLPQCVQDCINQAARTVFCDATQASCICDPALQNVVGTCVRSGCTAQEQTTATSFQQTVCSGVFASGPGISSTLQTSVSSAPQTSISSAPQSSTSPTAGTTGISASTDSRSTVTSTGPTSVAATSTASAGSAATSNNAAVPIEPQSIWALAAGLGVAYAL